MFVYHFAFDLRFYGVLAADFEHDPFWLGFRALIVAAFMVLVGMSLVPRRPGVGNARPFLAADRRSSPPCALLATIGSWILFPRTFIYFGMLHAIAVASVLANPWCAALVRSRDRMRRDRTRAPAVASGVRCASALLDRVRDRQARDRGLRAARALGRFRVSRDCVGARARAPGFPRRHPLASAPRWLRWLGRHSLAVYMVHQPILLGALWLVVRS